jgi:hypothetical protein
MERFKTKNDEERKETISARFQIGVMIDKQEIRMQEIRDLMITIHFKSTSKTSDND